jgi:hypothetical protein
MFHMSLGEAFQRVHEDREMRPPADVEQHQRALPHPVPRSASSIHLRADR